MAKRTAKDFSRNIIYKIAVEYATTREEYSYQYFCREYQISKSTFYTLLEKAVIENIVSTDIVMLMAKKAKNNSETKAGKECGKRSERHYQYLIQKRKCYMLEKEKSIEITKKYARSRLNKKEFCFQNHITTQLLERTILKAIISKWITDEIYDLLKKKSLNQNNTAKVIKFWEELENFR